MKTPIEIVEELTKMNDEEVATLLGVSRQTVISYKKGATPIPFDKLVKLSRASGVSLDAMLENNETYSSPHVSPTYSKFMARITAGVNAGASELALIRQHKYDQVSLTKDCVTAELSNMLQITTSQCKKPLVGFMGLSDTGKTTFINYLLNSSVVPASYGPLTSVSTYYMHQDERPKFLRNPLENAIVLGCKVESPVAPFQLNLLDQEDYVRAYLLKTGDSESILNAYSTRSGAFFKDDSVRLDAIVVFLDAPILKEVTLADFPGFNTGEERDDISLTMDASRFDVLFFLSRANGFFSTEGEISALAHILQNRSQTTSLYVLASHVNSIRNPQEVDAILDGGCARLVQVLSDDTCARLGITQEDHAALRSRFFGFAPQSDYYCQRLNTDIEATFPAIIARKLLAAEKEFVQAADAHVRQLDDSIHGLDALYGQTEHAVNETEAQEVLASIDAQYDDLRRQLKDEIYQCRKDCAAAFSAKYHAIISESFIEAAINRKDFKNRKRDLEALGNYLAQELNEAYTAVRQTYSSRFADKLTAVLKLYEQTWSDEKIKITMLDFDFARAFASGLVGLTTFGALSVWASVVAAGSNLGAYILIAKVVSALSAIGINLGGTAAVAAWVSSIGGPITLGIAFAIITAVTAFGIISGTWKSRVAKKFVKAFEKNNALEQCLASYESYWDETSVALDQALEAMHSQAKEAYTQKVHDQNKTYNEKIALKAILTMLYEQAKSAYVAMMNAVLSMQQEEVKSLDG